MDALAPTSSQADAAATARRFRAWLGALGPGPVLVLGHNDADGLSSIALFARALAAAGREVLTRVVGRGESPWSAEMASELAGAELAGVVIGDLGVRATAPRPDLPTLVVDHHVPHDPPPGAEVLTGHDMHPIPTTSLLAFWCAQAVADAEPWLWLAALGLIGDMAEDAGFPEMARARGFGITALRQAASLINAPRRTASGDAGPALRLLMAGDGPKAVTAGEGADSAALLAAKAEVKAELDAARRVAPVVRGGVALILFASPCQVHPLVAQQWRGRLKGEIVIAANAGYRPGWVHFAVRSARPLDLVAWLAERRPPGADEQYGSGHRQATGGALRTADWNGFVRALGFGPEQEVAEPDLPTPTPQESAPA